MTTVIDQTVTVAFDDNRLVPLLYGERDSHLARIEHLLGVSLASRGNQVTIRGPEPAVQRALLVLNSLWSRLEGGLPVGAAEIDTAVRFAGEEPSADPGSPLGSFNRPEAGIRTRKRLISPRTVTQAAYIEALGRYELTFGLGPAGTGKTYLAVAQAVSMLTSGQVDRIVLSRPAVEAGERLGFLPGDLKEKVDPYLRPLYDALHDLLPGDQVNRRLETGEIEIAPLAFMRGRTLSNAFIILDEAQNTTPTQMKMFLTRLGENSRMVVTGDLSQVDLPRGQPSGLRDAADLLAGIEGVDFVQFTDDDVVRHKLVTRIVQAYAARDASRAQEADLFAEQ